MPFVHGLYCVSIFFRIFLSSSTVPSRLSLPLLSPVFHYFVGTPSPCAPLLWSINTLPECLLSSIEHSIEAFVITNHGSL